MRITRPKYNIFNLLIIVLLQGTNVLSSKDYETMIQKRRVIGDERLSYSSSTISLSSPSSLNQHNQLRKRKNKSSSTGIKNQQVKDEHIPTETKRQLTTSLSDIFSLYGKLKDEPEDADADDYYREEFLSSNNQTFFNNTGNSFWMTKNQTTTSWSNIIPKSSKVKSTEWYELSHYVEPDSITYDVIEGFLVALLVCLIVATCYTYCYYYCLTRCGLVEDDRIYKSILHRKGRKVRELLLTRRRGRRRRLQQQKRKNKKKKGMNANKNAGKTKNCCSFSSLCCWKNEQDEDEDYNNGDKSLFAPLNDDGDDYENDDNSDDESLDDWNSDSDNSSSSLSQDSALSLEYGDKETFHDDYQGENNERLTDTKLEDAAKSFFEQQEKQEQMKKNAKVGIILTKEQKRKMKKSGSGRGARSIGSRRSRRSRGTSARSQASSILSSESGSLSSFNDGSSSEEDDDHSLEMESAMMDLELAEKRMGGTVV